MPDETLMTIGGVLFATSVIIFLVVAVLASMILPGLSLFLLLPAACAVAGVLVVLVGGFSEEAGGRVVFVRRIPEPIARIGGPPKFCARCGADFGSADRAVACPACGAPV